MGYRLYLLAGFLVVALYCSPLYAESAQQQPKRAPSQLSTLDLKPDLSDEGKLRKMSTQQSAPISEEDKARFSLSYAPREASPRDIGLPFGP
jgi:hypothetical protein